MYNRGVIQSTEVVISYFLSSGVGTDHHYLFWYIFINVYDILHN